MLYTDFVGQFLKISKQQTRTRPWAPQYGFSLTNAEDLRHTNQCTGSTVAHMVLTKIDKASVGVKEIIQASVNYFIIYRLLTFVPLPCPLPLAPATFSKHFCAHVCLPLLKPLPKNSILVQPRIMLGARPTLSKINFGAKFHGIHTGD